MGAYVRLDRSATAAMVARNVDAANELAAYYTRDRAKGNIVAKGRVDTARLWASIEARRVSPFQWTVGSPLHYAKFQEEGVRGPVLPVRAKVLRFKPKGSTQFVFARRTKGFPGAFFLRDALRRLSPRDFRR